MKHALALAALTLLTCASVRAQDRCDTSGGYDRALVSVPLPVRLERVIVGDMSLHDCELAMVEAAATADTSYRDVLQRIVTRYSAPDTTPIRNYFVVRPALYALHELGQPQDYFVPFVLNHRRNDLLADAALSALASDPDSTFWARVKPMWANLDSLTSGLSSGLSSYSFMLKGVQPDGRSMPLEARVERAVQEAAGFYAFPRSRDHYAFGESVGGDALDPKHVWWSRELRRLQRSHPALVAAAMARYTVRVRVYLARDPQMPPSYATGALSGFAAYMQAQLTRSDYRLDHRACVATQPGCD